MSTPHSFQTAQPETNKVIDHILSRVVFQTHTMDLYQHRMATNLVNSNKQSFEQITNQYPHQSKIRMEENRPISAKTDMIRPFSAALRKSVKMQTTNTKQTIQPCSFRNLRKSRVDQLLSHKIITDSITKKSKLKSQVTNNCFIPLQCNVQEQQSEHDKVIQILRKDKLAIQQYEKSKDNFITNATKQNQEYHKNKHKFITAQSSKNFTYTYDGILVELPKNVQSVRKKNRNSQQLRTQNRGEAKINNQNIYVHYQQNHQKTNIQNHIFNKRIDESQIRLQSTENMKYTMIMEDC